jgi:hypothetical protein
MQAPAPTVYAIWCPARPCRPGPLRAAFSEPSKLKGKTILPAAMRLVVCNPVKLLNLNNYSEFWIWTALLTKQ